MRGSVSLMVVDEHQQRGRRVTALTDATDGTKDGQAPPPDDPWAEADPFQVTGVDKPAKPVGDLTCARFY